MTARILALAVLAFLVGRLSKRAVAAAAEEPEADTGLGSFSASPLATCGWGDLCSDASRAHRFVTRPHGWNGQEFEFRDGSGWTSGVRITTSH